jgi:hypothetical protein
MRFALQNVQKMILGIQTVFANLLEIHSKTFASVFGTVIANQIVGVFTVLDSTMQGGGFVVGEFLIIRKLSSIYHWTNLIPSILFCSSFILCLSISEFLLWVTSKLSNLKLEDFIQRLQQASETRKPA